MSNFDIDKVLQLTQSITAMKMAGVDVPQSMMDSLNAMMQQAAGGGQAAVPEEKEEKKEEKKNFTGLQKKDLSCITCKEDFFNGELYQTLYGNLYSSYPGNPHVAHADISTVEYMLSEKAKQIGKTELQKLFKKKCTEIKAELKAENEQKKADAEKAAQAAAEAERQMRLEAGNMTRFENLPDGCKNIYVGEGWIADNDGVFMLEENKRTIKKVEASRFPFLIECLYQPYDAGAIGAEKCGVRFKSVHGDWRRKIVEQSTLMNAQKVLELAKSGFSINSRRAMAFTDYATSMLEESAIRRALPIHKMASSLGWTSDKKEFLPYTNNEFVFEKEDDFPGLTQAVSQPQGDRDAWYREFKEMRKTGVKMFNFATIVLLASPIVGMLPDVVNGFIGNIYGDTHTGKTICDSINSTIFGDYRSGYVIAFTPQSTPTGIEVRLNAHKNIPLVVEDANNADPAMIPKFIMQASNGAGALRGTKNLGNRAQMDWCLTVLANSENILTSYGNKGGMNGGGYTRVFAVQSESTFPKVWEKKIGYWKEFFATNYGYAGRDFVKILQDMGLKKIQELKKKFLTEILSRMREIGHSETQAEGLAMLRLADYIASKKLFKDDIMFTIDELISFTEDEDVIKPAKRFYNKIEDLMIGNPDRFEGLDEKWTERIADPENPARWAGEYWGLYRIENQQRWLCIRPAVLDRWLADGGVDRKLFFDFLREHDLIWADKGANTRKTDSAIYDRPRLINIKLIDSDCENEDDSSRPTVEERDPENPFLQAADEINEQRQLQIEEIEFK